MDEHEEMTAMDGRHTAEADFEVQKDATPNEIAAVTAVLRSVMFSPSDVTPKPIRQQSTWTRREDLLSIPPYSGPGAWRASARAH